jgi:hypothetical protein
LQGYYIAIPKSLTYEYKTVTFKDLQKVIQSQSQSPEAGISKSKFLKFRGKPFWAWDPNMHKSRDKASRGHCCFNHMIGLPTKHGVRKPLFEYQEHLYLALLDPAYINSYPNRPTSNVAYNFKVKHLWVKKATGLGVTEFMLRFMAWLC